jgi:outer membrane protein assembly factor BamB
VIAVDPATGRELWGFVAKAVSREVGIDERHVYAVTEEDTAFGTRHTLHALARAGGKEQWSQSVGGNIALAGDGVVYTEGARIEAFDAATGKPLWSRAMAPGDSVRLLSGGKLFVTSPTVTYFGTDRVDRGRLRALDAKSAH